MSIELSLIVPAYNVAPYLEDCINSIIANTYQNYEILLVDDGSTDNTGAICDRLAQKYEKITVFHTENRGLSEARNLGLNHANGKFIIFVDADDIIAPNMLEVLVSHMTDDVQMVVCRFIRCNRIDCPTDSISLQPSHQADLQEAANKILLDGYGCYVWNKIFRKSILDEHGIAFPNNELFMEDVFFMMDYLPYCKNVIFLEDQLYYYITNNGSIMNTFRSKKGFSKKYTGLPRSWVYIAEVMQPISNELVTCAQARAVMYYQTVLRKLEAPDSDYIIEAIDYVKKHKAALLHYHGGWKDYLSAVILSMNYKLWACIFRRRIGKQ